MLNLVAVQVMNYLLAGPLHRHDGGLGRRADPADAAPPREPWLPILRHGTQLHLGVLVAVLAAVAAYVLLWRTSFGFRLRAVGLSRDAARYAGMPVARTTTLALTLSGALCGLAGRDPRVRQRLAPHGHRRHLDRVHRLGRLQRHRRGAVRRAEPAVDDPRRRSSSAGCSWAATRCRSRRACRPTSSSR